MAGPVRDVTVRLLGDVKDYVGKNRVAVEATKMLLGQLQVVENALNRTKFALAATSAGLTAANVAATFTASRWQDAFTSVEKTVTGTEAQLEGVGRSIRDVSRDTPIAAEHLASLAGAAGQLGVSVQSVDEFAETAAQLGDATDLDAEGAIFQLSQLLGVMKENEGRVDNLAAGLTFLGNTSKTTESRILDFSQNIAGTASTVGLASEEVMGIAAAFTSAGIESEAGGTAVQRVLLEMNEAAISGGQNLAAFANILGMTRDEFQQLYQEDPAEVFVRFIESLQGAGKEAQLLLNQLGLNDARLTRAFLNTANSGDSVRASIEGVTAATKANTALTEEAERRYSNLSSELAQLGNVMTESRRAVGEAFLPAASAAVGVVSKMADAFNALPRPIQLSVGGFSAAAAGLTALGARAISVGQDIGGLGIAFKLLSETQLGQRWFGTLAARAEVAKRAFLRLAGQGGLKAVTAGLRSLPGRALDYFKDLGSLTWTGLRQLPAILRATGRGLRSYISALSLATKLSLGLGAALLVAGEYMRRQRDSVETTTEALERYAETYEKTYDAVAGAELSAGGDSVQQFGENQQKLIQQLREIDELSREHYIFQVGLEFLRGGAEIADVKELVNQLAEATGTELTFDVDAGTLGTFNEQLAAANNRFQLLADQIGQSNMWSMELRGLADSISTIFDADREIGDASGLPTEALKQLRSEAAELQRTLEEGEVGTAKALVQISEFASAIENLSGGEQIETVRVLTREMEKLSGVEFDERAMQRMVTSQGVEGFRREFTRQLTNALSEGVIPEDVDLYSEEALRRWIVEAERATEATTAGFQEQSRLMAMLGEEYQKLEKAEKKRYLDYKINEAQARHGLEYTLGLLQEEINMRRKLGDVATEEYAALEQAAERIEDKLFDRQKKELEDFVEGLEPAEAMEAVNQAIKELDQASEGYIDRLGQLEDMQSSIIEDAKSNLMNLVRAEQNIQDQRAEAREGHAERMVDIEQRESDAIADAIESRNDRLDDLADQRRDRMADLYERRAESLAGARRTLDERLADINETYRTRLAEQATELANWASLTERVFTEASMSPDALILNIENQQQQFEDWQRGLAKLRERGLSANAVDMLGLEESPRQLAQVQQLLRASEGDLSRINKMVMTRERQASRVAKAQGGEARRERDQSIKSARADYREAVREINKDFEKGLAEAARDYERGVREVQAEHRKALNDIHQDTAKAVADNNRELSERMQELAEDFAKLGRDAGEGFGDMLEKGLKSKNANIRAAARDLKKLLDDQARESGRSVNRITKAAVEGHERLSGAYARALAKNVNPVLKATGGKPIRTRSGHNVSQGGRSGPGVFQQGGEVPWELVRHQRDGGRVGGNGSGDVVKALVEPGEFIIPRGAVNFYGREPLEGIRRKEADPAKMRDIRRYHAGGPVDPDAPQHDQAGRKQRERQPGMREVVSEAQNRSERFERVDRVLRTEHASYRERFDFRDVQRHDSERSERSEQVRQFHEQLRERLREHIQERRSEHSTRQEQLRERIEQRLQERISEHSDQRLREHTSDRVRESRSDRLQERTNERSDRHSQIRESTSESASSHSDRLRENTSDRLRESTNERHDQIRERVIERLERNNVATPARGGAQSRRLMFPMATNKPKMAKQHGGIVVRVPDPAQPVIRLQSGGIVQLGRQIERMGFDVGEHPSFGGVAPVHSQNSWHYKAAALDINWHGNNERAKLSQLARWINQRIDPRELFWPANDPVGGHHGHLHVAWPGGGEIGPGGGLGGFSLPEPPAVKSGAIGRTAKSAMEHMRDQVAKFLEETGYGFVEGYEGADTDLKRMVRRLAKRQEGWGDAQWPALNRLVQKESSWRPTAQNPTSTAYGLFQFLDSTWATVGATKTSNPYKQAQAGLQYIDQRYGTPGAALAFHNRNNWYGDGGIFDRPQVIGVGERGREAVMPLSGRGIGVLSEALQTAILQSNLGGMSDSVNYGPITVRANDPREMERQLTRQRKLRKIVSLGVHIP